MSIKHEQDPIVEKIVNEFVDRSNEGLKKYGMSLRDNEAGSDEFIQHAKEEAMDFTLYLEKLREVIETEKQKQIQSIFLDLVRVAEWQDNKLAICDIEQVLVNHHFKVDYE